MECPARTWKSTSVRVAPPHAFSCFETSRAWAPIAMLSRSAAAKRRTSLCRGSAATKIGAGTNVERELTDRTRIFGRLGWNDGRNESFAHTEVDRTAEMPFDIRPFGTRRLLDNSAWLPFRTRSPAR